MPPANLRLDYRPLPELLKQARLLATLSSTAFFDALDFGCRAIAISDLGLQPDYGGHVYAGSGVWRSLEAIPNLDALDAEGPSPDPRWLEWMGYGRPVQPSALLEALNEQKGQTPETIHQQHRLPGECPVQLQPTALGSRSRHRHWRLDQCPGAALPGIPDAPPAPRCRPPLLGRAPSNPLLRQIALLISYRDLK